MAIKQYRPLTPARRFATHDPMKELDRKRPERSLITRKRRTGGRDSQGHISVRHRGGGAHRFIRQIDLREDRPNMVARVQALEYDPNRSARIALVEYPDQQRRYVLAPDGIKIGMELMVSPDGGEMRTGNRYPLSKIPIGSFVCNVELKPGQGGRIARAAGTQVQLVALEGGYAHLRLPSSEERKVVDGCYATIGSMSNPDQRHQVIGKAGRNRHRGWRPTVRGKVMNPVDHPHGGGEGKQPIGLKFAKTKWGKHALGVKTRKAKKYSDRWILHRRKK